MRLHRFRIFAAILPIIAGVASAQAGPEPVYSQTAQQPADPAQSAYEKMADIEPLDPLLNHAPTDYELVRQRYDQANTALAHAKDQVLARLGFDPKFKPLDQAATDSQKRYDDEIDDALSVLSWMDDYQELVGNADRAAAEVQSIQKTSPQDQQSIQNAQQRFDDARRKLDDCQDNFLDHDRYVQQARQNSAAAQDARDRAVQEAFAADVGVRNSQAQVDREQQALDLAQANQPKNQPPQTQQAASSPVIAESYPPIIYDNGDSQPVPQITSVYTYAAPSVTYVEPYPVYVEPYYNDYGYFFAYSTPFIRDRYHRERDRNFHDGRDRNDGRFDFRNDHNFVGRDFGGRNFGGINNPSANPDFVRLQQQVDASAQQRFRMMVQQQQAQANFEAQQMRQQQSADFGRQFNQRQQIQAAQQRDQLMQSQRSSPAMRGPTPGTINMRGGNGGGGNGNGNGGNGRR